MLVATCISMTILQMEPKYIYKYYIKHVLQSKSHITNSDESNQFHC